MAERKARPEGPVENIDESDRLVIVTRMKERSVRPAELARVCDVSPSAITLLLKNPIPKGKTRGCKFLAKLQAHLGLAITAKRPAAIPSDKLRRAEHVMKALLEDDERLENWLKHGELLMDRSRK